MRQRMAATIQFNPRGAGVHQVELMGDLIQALSSRARPTRRSHSIWAWTWKSVPAQTGDRHRRAVQKPDVQRSWKMMEVDEGA